MENTTVVKTGPRASAPRLLRRMRRVRWQPGGAAKYQVLRDALVEAIVAEKCAPGDLLPTEADLAEATPFSLGTVQRAVRSLVEDGLVKRRKGFGTFVTGHTKPMPDPLQCRFVAGDGDALLPVFPRVLERTRIAQRGPWSEPLGQRRDNILRIDRLIDIDDAFSVFARFHARVDLYPELETVPATELDGESLTRRMLASGEPLRIDQRVRCVTLPPWASAPLGLDGTAGLKLTSIAYSRERAVYHQEIYVPPTPSDLKVGP